MKTKLLISTILALMLTSLSLAAENDLQARRDYLKQVKSWLPPDRPGRGEVSPLDKTWTDWLNRTGELPPDFDKMPSIPFLPDPLVLDEGGKNIPVETPEQWQQKRQWIAEQVKHWLTGTFPPPPDNLEAKILRERKDGRVTIRTVELRFGPQQKGRMTAELIIPPGPGPFPVFMTQWNHRLWALVAVRRGYIACSYAGADNKDDTDQYADIWYPEFDFTRLMRRAWGASRVVDYLCTLPEVDKDKIAITGHSRNGKQSIMAAAFDQRITACISSSAGTGGEVPWRYTAEPFNNETITDITTNFQHWFHPRLRFFVGREHKLPIDQNLLMALIAPRGLMLSTAVTEHLANPWGIEQCYHSLNRVYTFLDAPDGLALRNRWGRHGTSARDIEDYIDFFDYCFGRSARKPQNRLYYDYTFPKWQQLSAEKIDLAKYPAKTPDDLLKTADGSRLETAQQWAKKKTAIRDQLRWLLGDEPPGATNPGPRSWAGIPSTDVEYSGDYLARVIGRPRTGGPVRRLVIGRYYGFGDYLEGNLYYPADNRAKPKSNSLPVIIWLHEYNYGTGFARTSDRFIEGLTKAGFAVFLFDQIGCGTRIAEGTDFYNRYPHFSKLGKMVADTKAAVDMLSNLENIDAQRIYAGGYSLGGTVALFTAALDERIQAVISVAGLTPLQTARGEHRRTASGEHRRTTEKDDTAIRWYSHLHGLLPRLGFFAEAKQQIPCDFQEILACIAPRQILVVAPRWDRFADFRDVQHCVASATELYTLLGAAENVELSTPDDYNRFSEQTQQKVLDWVQKNL